MRSSSMILVFAVLALASLAGADNAREIYNPNEPFVSQPPAGATEQVTLSDAPEAVLYDNGPLVTTPGGGAGGNDISELQVSLGMSTLGFGHQWASGNSVADDFTVGGFGWQIDDITVFAYQTGSGTTSALTGVYMQIWDGSPDDPASSVVWGDLTTNRLSATSWTNIYRVADTSQSDTQRPIMRAVASVGATLAAGNYWVEWSVDGSGASGPWAPPISILGTPATGNAMQNTGTWVPAQDTGTLDPQGLPFIIEGNVVGPPPPPPQGSFFVVDENANQLYSVDPDTAVATYIGPTVEDPSFSGMAFDTSTGIIYISDITLPNGWGLGFVDWVTGAVNIIGSHVNTNDIHALAYDVITNTLWGSDLNCPGGYGLAAVDRGTGESTCIGSFGTPSAVGGLAYDQTTDALYGINDTNLLTIDRGTGAATVVGPHGIPGMWAKYGLEFIPDRSVFVVTTESGDLYEVDPADGGSVLVGNTGLTDASGSAYVPFRAPAFPPFPGLLHDNGATDLRNGLSNGIPPALPDRRTVLDDFEVPPGQTWAVQHFRWHHAWSMGGNTVGDGVEIHIRNNDPDGGGPGVDGPGAMIATATVGFFTGTVTDGFLLGRPVMASVADFDPIVLSSGRYWIEWAIHGPDGDYATTSYYGVKDNQGWVNPADLGGLQPVEFWLGQPADFAWAIGEAGLGIFADDFESNDTTAWSMSNP